MKYKMSNVLTMLTFTALGLAGGFLMGTQVVRPQIEEALEQCIGEVEPGCPLLYQYVSELERENARLNVAMQVLFAPESLESVVE